jgi:hypothetical protein
VVLAAVDWLGIFIWLVVFARPMDTRLGARLAWVALAAACVGIPPLVMRVRGRPWRWTLVSAVGGLALLVGVYVSPAGGMLVPWPSRQAVSPEGTQRMIAYRIPMLMAMPGGGSDADALVELRTAGGWLEDVANPLYWEDHYMYAETNFTWDDGAPCYGTARCFR